MVNLLLEISVHLKSQNVLLDSSEPAEVCTFGISKFKNGTFGSTVNGQAGKVLLLHRCVSCRESKIEVIYSIRFLFLSVGDAGRLSTLEEWTLSYSTRNSRRSNAEFLRCYGCVAARFYCRWWWWWW